MKKIGIICALRSEATCLGPGNISPGQPVYLDEHCLLQLSGMGENNARQAARIFLAEDIDVLVSFGTCAGLQKGIHAGELLIPENVITDKLDKIAFPKDLHKRLQSEIQDCPAPTHFGDLFCSKEVISGPSGKREAQKATRAMAVDMESAYIIDEASAKNIPVLCIKIVVDEYNMEIPPEIMKITDPYGEIRWLSLLATLLRKPGLVPDLIRLGRAFGRASRTMRWIGQNRHQLLNTIQPV